MMKENKNIKPDVSNMALSKSFLQKVGFLDQQTKKGESTFSVANHSLRTENVLQEAKNFFEYHVIEIIGTGGMGKVYKAIHEKTKQIVAIKTMKNLDKSGSERFRREYRFLNTVNHPNLIKAYDFKQVGEELFMVMEFVEGQSLRELLERRTTFSLLDKVAIASQITQGIDALNLAGIIHRDVKPANIMVDITNGIVKILDLGLSKNIGRKEMRLTQDKQILGTIGYMAPEQVEGELADTTDIFALGTVLYQWFTGDTESPFDSESPYKTFVKIATLEPVSLLKRIQQNKTNSKFWNKLDRIIAKAMQKKPEKRQENAGIIFEKLLKIHQSILDEKAIPENIITTKTRWDIKKSDINQKNTLISMRNEFMDKDISITSSSVITTKPTTHKKKIKQKTQAFIFIAVIVFSAVIGIISFTFSEKETQKIHDKIEKQLEIALQEANRLLEQENYGNAKILYDRINKKYNSGIAQQKLKEIARLLKKKEKTNPGDFITAINNEPDEFGNILRKYWLKEEMCFDFSHQYWQKLDTAKQIEYVGKYQEWYAKAKNTTIEKTITVNNAKFEMMLIPPGRFWMGSLITEEGHQNNESRHQVWISQPFWLGKTEVTQRQWREVVDPSGKQNGTYPWQKNRDYAIQDESHPVTLISWNDISKMFLDIANDSKLQLPTEAQWEYACRGGTTSRFYWGNSIDRQRINSISYRLEYDLQDYHRSVGELNNKYLELLKKNNIVLNSLELLSDEGQKATYLLKKLYANNIGTTPVMYFKDKGNKNPFGLYDMLGNVWEWCQDSYDQDFYNVNINGISKNPQNSTIDSFVVGRGGGLIDGFLNCRPAKRNRFLASGVGFNIGFRLSSLFE